MKRFLVGLALVTAIGVGSLASAQTTIQPVFQTVTVGGLGYTIDPFYVVACFWIRDTPGGRIWDGTQVVEEGGEATVQCFHRDKAGAMVPWSVFATTNDGVLDHAELGQPMYGKPQVAMGPQG